MPDSLASSSQRAAAGPEPALQALLARSDAAVRRRRLAAAGSLIAALVLGGLGLMLLQRNASQPPYVTTPALRGDLTIQVTATGSVQPTTKVDVSSEQSGTIRRVLADYNSAVRAGDLLAELDTDKLRASVASARARLEAARAQVEVARATLSETGRELARKRGLAGGPAALPHDLDAAQAAVQRAEAGVAAARADVAVAEAGLRLDETNLAKARIVSPITGVVLVRNVDPGQTVAVSLQAPVLFSIAEDLAKMEAQVDVDEADIGAVRDGQSATFSVDAYPERRFPASIRMVRYASAVLQGVVTYKAVLTVDNADLLLRPGMTVTADIRVQELRDVLQVPNAALRFTPPAETAARSQPLLTSLVPGMPRFRGASRRDGAEADRRIWVLRDGTPVMVPVRLGPSDGHMTQIREGALSPGDAVITGLAPKG